MWRLSPTGHNATKIASARMLCRALVKLASVGCEIPYIWAKNCLIAPAIDANCRQTDIAAEVIDSPSDRFGDVIFR
jgi:hypothetical protein